MSTRRTIMVIRHGEKPDGSGQPPGVDAFGDVSDHGLTPTGWARARALADIFWARTVPAPFACPTALYAPHFGGAERARRPYLTLIPTCQALATPILSPVAEGHEDDLAHLLAHTATPCALVCWEHHHIPALATALATRLAVADRPPNCQTWPDDDYSSALVFTQGPDGWRLVQVSEGVLPGDPPRSSDT